jgi:thiol-disulfide isomerase/thioredoxin
MTSPLRQMWMLLILLSTLSPRAYTQDQQPAHPVINMEIPDFIIRNMQNIPDSALSKDNLKGKFTILNFWSRFCSACVGFFPDLNTINEQFNDQVTIILIGTEDKQARMRPIYEKVRQKLRLTIPYAFDSVLFNQFVPQVVPHLIWIDNSGIVRAITGASDLRAENIRLFLNGERFQFFDWSFDATKSRQSKSIDINQPFLHDGNGGTTDKMISRSLLVRYEPDRMAFVGFPSNIDRVINYHPNPALLQGCAGLEKLYRFAFTGYPSWFYNDPVYKDFYPRCILNVRDKSAFDTDQSLTGFYWYSLLVPEKVASSDMMLKAMQSDLEKSFGFRATVVQRRVPCWVVTSSARARRTLKATGRENNGDRIDPAELILSSVSMDKFIATVFYKHIENQQPIVNKTKIRHPFDVSLSVNLYDFNDIRQALERLGLNLKEKKRKMKVIVIKDQS